jgi:beta-carotene 3-hydroxylase
MTTVIQIAVFLMFFAAALIGMEGVAWVAHRYLMHGALWCWHRGHHEPRRSGLELNDLFAVLFATPAIVCIYLGVQGDSSLLAVGLGITAYGGIYFMFHDGLVHRRFRTPLSQNNRFWKPRIQAHHLHHTVATKDGCVSFGFLWAPPVRQIKEELIRRRHANQR